MGGTTGLPEPERRGRVVGASATKKAIVAALLVVIALAALVALIQVPWSQAINVADSRGTGMTVPTDSSPQSRTSEVRVAHGKEIGAHNTGVVDEDALVPSGSVTSSHDGQVIENLEITGALRVHHDAVTVRNVRVLATSVYGLWHDHEEPGHNTLIEDVDIIGVDGQRSAGVSPYGSWTLRRAHVRGFVDAVKVGSDQRIEESWLEDDYYYPPGSHNDAIQSVGGSNVEIVRSRIEGPWQGQTSALILSSERAPLTDYLVEKNLISGGNYSIYTRAKEDPDGVLQPHPANVVFRGNVFVRDSWQFGIASFDGNPNIEWQDNVYEDGTPAP